MKRLFLFTIVLLFAFSIATKAAGVSLGVKGGMAISSLTGDFVDELEEEIEAELDSKTSFTGGVFADLGLSEKIGLQPEILYISKGAEASEEEGKVTISVNYLEIPVLLKLKIPASPGFMFQILAGPSIGMKLDAKGVVESEEEGTEEVDLNDDIKSMAMGISFGAGFGIKMGGSILTLDGRYSMDLTSVAESSDEEIKTNNIIIMAGIGFPLGG